MDILVKLYMKTSVLNFISVEDEVTVSSNPSNLLQLFESTITNRKMCPIDWASGVILKIYFKTRKKNEFVGNNNFSYSKVLQLNEIFEDPFVNHDDVAIFESSEESTTPGEQIDAASTNALQDSEMQMDIDAIVMSMDTGTSSMQSSSSKRSIEGGVCEPKGKVFKSDAQSDE